MCHLKFLTVFLIFIDFSLFFIVGNTDEYSTKEIQSIYLHLNYVPTLPDKSKNNIKSGWQRLVVCLVRPVVEHSLLLLVAQNLEKPTKKNELQLKMSWLCFYGPQCSICWLFCDRAVNHWLVVTKARFSLLTTFGSQASLWMCVACWKLLIHSCLRVASHRLCFLLTTSPSRPLWHLSRLLLTGFVVGMVTVFLHCYHEPDSTAAALYTASCQLHHVGVRTAINLVLMQNKADVVKTQSLCIWNC